MLLFYFQRKCNIECKEKKLDAFYLIKYFIKQWYNNIQLSDDVVYYTTIS